MSITLLTSPTASSIIAAAAPVWVRAESDAEETAYTIIGVSDSGGSVELTASSFAGLVANNVLSISGATGDYAYLNGLHDVVTAGATACVINLAYASASTGTRGTASIVLDKWCMGIDLEYDIDGDTTAIGTYYVPFLNQIGIRDISRALCGIFYSAFSLTDGWTSELNKCFFTINAAIFEASVKVDRSRAALDSEVVIFYAARSAMLTGRILEAGYQNKLLNGTTTVKVHAGTKVIMSAVTKESDISAYYSYNIGVSNTNGTDDFDTDNFKGNYVFTPVAGSTGIQLYIKDDEGNRISEIMTVQLLSGSGCNVYPLYWLNHYGGYDVYEFTEITETNATGNRQELNGVMTAMGNMVDKDYSTESWQEVKLIGRNETETALAYLRDLFVSPEIYNAAGERVKLLSSGLITRSRENVTPEVTILVNRGATIW